MGSDKRFDRKDHVYSHGKFICNLYADSDIWESFEFFDTKAEAIKTVIQHLTDWETKRVNDLYMLEDVLGQSIDPEEEITTFAIGRCNAGNTPDISTEIIELLQNHAYEQYGDYVNSFLTHVPEKHLRELSDLINNWVQEHNYDHGAFEILDVETINVADYREGVNDE